MNNIRYIDLFAGAGGLSEGFIRQGFQPVAHVEIDKASCFTLKTRLAFHQLSAGNQLETYKSYLEGSINRERLYSYINPDILDSVINAEIGKDNSLIFNAIDSRLNGEDVDLIIGGPPCQAYSVIGRPALKHKINDERTTLYIQYGRFLKRYHPKVFVFENVPGLLTAGDGKYFKNLKKYFKSIGYEVEAKTVNAFDFGVIQHRERVIIIGWRKDINFTYPEFTLLGSNFSRDDIFDDLPAIRPGENCRFQRYSCPSNNYLETFNIRNGFNFVSQHITRNHNSDDLVIYRLAISMFEAGNRIRNDKIPAEIRTQNNTTDFIDRFKVVGKLPHTLIAHIAKDGHHFIHPDPDQLRSISVREAARIQSFPDNYFFEGIKESQPRTPAFRQIGNAVPPLMAEKIAYQIKEMINGR